MKNLEHSTPLVEVRNLTFTYPDTAEPSINDLSLTIHTGELVILTGPSGCGKSTLCRHFNGIIPHLSAGVISSGTVVVKGMDVSQTPVHEMATTVGMVHQNPDSQLVCLEVRDELAFGPENIGLSHDEIVSRITRVIDWIQLQKIADLLTFQCSGGQKQRVALGSSLTLLPDLLVLDEPTTDLDPVGTQDVVKTICRIRDTLGLTFVIVEHGLDELLDVADRLIVMERGRIMLDGSPTELLTHHYDEMERIGLRIPQHIAISRRLALERGDQTGFPLGKQDAVRAFAGWTETFKNPVILPVRQSEHLTTQDPSNMVPAVKVENVAFSYGGGHNVVEGINLQIMPGEFVAMVGANGCGKSTLARLLIGLLHPQNGKINILGMDTRKTPIGKLTMRAGYLFQNPDAQLFNTSVEAEVSFGMRVKRMAAEEISQRVDEVLTLLGLQHYKDRHPFALSRGERQRLALATVLVTDPDLIILDEPTTGQDRIMLDGLIHLMRQWIERKCATVLMISHDMGLVCQHAERTIVMSGGHIITDGPTSEVFYRQFNALREMSLLPPSVVEVSFPLVGSRLSRVLLSIEEFNWMVQQHTDEINAMGLLGRKVVIERK
jgi:energy-coupling factor transport system ATP-binding protein